MPALDGVRGLAILMVMVHHCTVFQPGNAAERWLHFATGFGGFGVDLFFVLSGFLITGILFDAKGTKGTGGAGERTPAGRFFGNFYARRTLRIFPLYYAVVFTALVLFPHAGSLLQHVAGPSTASLIQSKLDRFSQVDGYDAYFWLYLSNFPIAWTGSWLHGILGVCWSLAIEEQFYLVWPLVIYFLSRKGAVRVCFVLIGVALLCRVALTVVLLREGYEPTVPLANPTGIFVLTFARMDTLAFGALLALALRGSVSVTRLASAARWVVPVGLVCLVALAVVEEVVGPQRAWFDAGCGPVYQTIGYLANGLVGAGVLVLALHTPASSLWGGVWRNRLLVMLGKYSYALYLFHLPIRAVVRDVVFGPRVEGGGGPKVPFFEVAGSQVPAQAVFYVVSMALALAAAWVSWQVLEKPFLSLKRFFPSGSKGVEGR